MSDASFLLRVVTPQGLLVEAQVTAVTLPASDGEIGVLPGHIGYTGLLGTGLLTYVPLDSDNVKQVVVSGGFCRFGDATLVIIADSADTKDTVNFPDVRAKKEEVISTIQSVSGYEPEWDAARQELTRIEAIEQLK